MRLTGQPTTAIGNLIVNLLVHRRFFKREEQSIKFFLALGDDGCFGMEERPLINDLEKEIKTYYNIKCKPDIN